MRRPSIVTGVAAALGVTTVATHPAVAEADAPVKIASVPDGPIELAVSADAGELRRAFRLVPNQVASVTIEQVRLIGCSDDKSQACAARVEPGGCAGGCQLTATDAGEVTVVVTMPKPGVYRASLEVVYVAETKKGDDKNEEPKALLATTLQVTRPEPAIGPMNLAVSGARGAELELPVAGSAGTQLSLRVQDDRAAMTTVDKVVAAPLVRKNGSDELATTAAVALFTWNGDKREPIADAQALALGPAGARLAIEVSDLPAPGKYEGKLRLSAANCTTQEIAYTITARRSPWLAALLIAIGAVLSYGVQFWSGKRRATLVQQRALQRLRERLLGYELHGSRDRELVDVLMHELDDRLDALEDGGTASDDLTLVARRVDLVAAAIRAGEAIERLPSQARADARSQLEAKLGVLRDRAATAAVLDTLATELTKIASDTVRRAALGELLVAVDAAVRVARAALPAALQARVATEVDAALREARAASDRNQLDAFDAALSKARVALARIQGAALVERLPEAPLPKPFEKTPEPYRALRSELLAALAALNATEDADEATRSYTDLVARMAAAFRDAMGSWLRTEGQGKPKTVADQLDQLASEAAATAAGASGEALVILDGLVGKAGALLAAPAPLSVSAARGAPGAPSSSSSSLAALPQAGPEPRIADVRAARSRATQAIAFGDGVVFVAVLLIAITTGLKLLWVDSPMWGTWSDCLTALLWGAGLHAVGNEPFKGLLGLKSDFGKSA